MVDEDDDAPKDGRPLNGLGCDVFGVLATLAAVCAAISQASVCSEAVVAKGTACEVTGEDRGCGAPLDGRGRLLACCPGLTFAFLLRVPAVRAERAGALRLAGCVLRCCATFLGGLTHLISNPAHRTHVSWPGTSSHLSLALRQATHAGFGLRGRLGPDARGKAAPVGEPLPGLGMQATLQAKGGIAK